MIYYDCRDTAVVAAGKGANLMTGTQFSQVRKAALENARTYDMPAGKSIDLALAVLFGREAPRFSRGQRALLATQCRIERRQAVKAAVTLGGTDAVAATRNCPRCHGEGVTEFATSTYCSRCEGTGIDTVVG
jgi:hypothetical protein